TTGLAGGTGTAVFILGLGRLSGETLIVTRYLLTAFSGEKALWQAMTKDLAGVEVLITYNGRRFDQPIIDSRCRLLGLPGLDPALHAWDLLYPVRRAFRTVWPDCRLMTVEERLLSHHRQDDLPGSEAPWVWREWLQQGIRTRLKRVLDHNGRDVESLAALLLMLPRVFTEPMRFGADMVGVSKSWIESGDTLTAVALLSAARRRLDDRALFHLSLLYRQQEAWQGAVSLWQVLASRGHVEAMERLAKYHEHIAHDLDAALRWTGHLIRVDGAQPAHLHRQQRLEKKRAGVGKG
ncbi:MAG: ribonuclease H-like domain-containing protein, partial [Magnetococcales bacterium]|nr:ribonuclease H-like domain-containing protein [Magnetococcales bacterium]